MARLDHKISRTRRLSARFDYAHGWLSSFEARNNDLISGLLAFVRTAALNTLDPTAVLSLNSVLGPQALNDLYISWGQRKSDITPNGLGAPVNIPGGAFLGRENILPHYRKEKYAHIGERTDASFQAYLSMLRLNGKAEGLLGVQQCRIEQGQVAVLGSQQQRNFGAPENNPLSAPVAQAFNDRKKQPLGFGADFSAA
jgi:hypothetical protein